MCLGAYTEFKVYSTYRDGDRSDFNWPSPTKDLSACFYAIAATVGVAVGSITSITSISIGESRLTASWCKRDCMEGRPFVGLDFLLF